MSDPIATLHPLPDSATFRHAVTAQVAIEHSEDDAQSGDTQSDEASPPPSAPQPSKIKYVDHVYNKNNRAMEYVDTTSDLRTAAVASPDATTASGDWQNYDFVVVRTFPGSWTSGDPIAVRIVIKNKHLGQACREVMNVMPGLGISWTSDPLELSLELLLVCLPRLKAYEAALESATHNDNKDNTSAVTSIHSFIDHLEQHYESTLARIQNLVSHGEITFDLLWAIFLPGTTIITCCPVTGEPQAQTQMGVGQRGKDPRSGCWFYVLGCVGVEHAVVEDDHSRAIDPLPPFGLNKARVCIPEFKGIQKISALSAVPMQYHADQDHVSDSITQKLTLRGRKWALFNGKHHVAYRGLAMDAEDKKYSVDSRIMIDKTTFVRINPNVEVPTPNRNVPCESFALDEYSNTGEQCMRPIPTDRLVLLATPVVYGFSLKDKMWLRFNVQNISRIEWNTETFQALELPPDRKILLRSLVEAHGSDSDFDDFVRGKGQGLVIGLFGPPGVGKTLSAEATSEHLQRPLYVVGGGDLGTTPREVDRTLEEVFDIATCWNAIVLIDEADVFLEKRSSQNLQHNAIVAVFLRHIEYHRGILFFTTNRINSFDRAFLSRIHVALQYEELDIQAKIQIWHAFFKKAKMVEGQISDELVEKLAQRNVNGRQIKNACRIATFLARSQGVEIQYEHLEGALDAGKIDFPTDDET